MLVIWGFRLGFCTFSATLLGVFVVVFCIKRCYGKTQCIWFSPTPFSSLGIPDRFLSNKHVRFREMEGRRNGSRREVTQTRTFNILLCQALGRVHDDRKKAVLAEGRPPKHAVSPVRFFWHRTAATMRSLTEPSYAPGEVTIQASAHSRHRRGPDPVRDRGL